MIRRFAFLASAASLGAMLFAGVASAESTLDKIKSSGVVRYGVATEPPLSDFRSATEITGAEPDIAQIIFQRMGAPKVEASVMDYGALIPGLHARRFDVAATGLFIRPERCKAVAFSNPQLCMAEAFLVKKGNPLGITSYQALKDKKGKIAAAGGGAEERRALEIGVPREDVFGVVDIFNAVKLLQSGRVDALGFPDVSLEEVRRKVNDDSLELVTPLPGEPVSCSGTAFNPKDTDLRDAYDAELAKMQESGELAEILVKYGFNPDLLETASREQLCQASN